MPLPLKASKEWLFGRGQLGDVCPEMYWCPGACVAQPWGKVDIRWMTMPIGGVLRDGFGTLMTQGTTCEILR